jgi:hypothetical protein
MATIKRVYPANRGGKGYFHAFLSYKNHHRPMLLLSMSLLLNYDDFLFIDTIRHILYIINAIYQTKTYRYRCGRSKIGNNQQVVVKKQRQCAAADNNTKSAFAIYS